MSANNAVYIVHEISSGKFSVWYNGCVDNPFPSSCSRMGEFEDELTAYHKARQVVEDIYIVEYGISSLCFENIPCSHIGDETWQFCCSLNYGHDGDHNAETQWCFS